MASEALEKIIKAEREAESCVEIAAAKGEKIIASTRKEAKALAEKIRIDTKQKCEKIVSDANLKADEIFAVERDKTKTEVEGMRGEAEKHLQAAIAAVIKLIGENTVS